MDASIIIPTYNRLWSLPEAIASCPRDAGVEIIVVDDGSTDGTRRWLEGQPDLKVIRQANWGKPSAVNAGLAAATGEYVRFLDSDDLLVPEQVMMQLRCAQRSRADICVAGYWEWREASGRRTLHEWRDCGDFIAQQLGECDSSHYSAFFFRRDFLRDVAHRPEFAFRDDRMFILECALKTPEVTIWPEPTLIHRHHHRPRIQFQPGSTLVVTNWQELRMFEKVAGLLEARGLWTVRRQAAMTNNLWPLALRIAAYDRREALDLIRWLRALNPGFRIPSSGIGRLYRLFGFTLAQSVVNAARFLRNRWRAVHHSGNR